MAGRPGRSALIEQSLPTASPTCSAIPAPWSRGSLTRCKTIRPCVTFFRFRKRCGDDGRRLCARNAPTGAGADPQRAGLGNAIGAIYQAMRGQSPLVMIGGDAGLKYLPMQAQMSGDLVAMAEPVTKWAAMVSDPSSLLRMVRRAIKIAATPPMGPVYVCLPADVLDQNCPETVEPSFVNPARVAPEESVLLESAKMLAAAKCPVLFVGDGVAYSERSGKC